MRHLVFIHRGPDGPSEMAVAVDGKRFVFRIDGRDESAEAVRLPDGRLSLVFDGGRQICGRILAGGNGEVLVSTGSGCRAVALAEPLRDRIAHAPGGPTSVDGDVEIRAQMPGRVVDVAVAPGDEVEAGGLLLVLEAMKMQNEIRATRPGRVLRVEVEAGKPVDGGARLVVFHPVGG
jgi:biotin carboxyl carrier protein